MSKKQRAYVKEQNTVVENENVQVPSSVSIQEQLESFARIIVDIYLETEHDKIYKQEQ